MNDSCEIILDLIPLVKDGVASAKSTAAVEAHIAGCDACRAAFLSLPPTPEAVPTAAEARILGALRRSLRRSRIVLVCAGLLLGLLLSGTAGMFYNLLLMPAVGLLGSYLWKRHWYWPAAAVFVCSYLWQLAALWADEGLSAQVAVVPLAYSCIYAVLALTGTAIGLLLRYAFGKGETL